eukprot:COSAG01_NODE_5525_length_4205_cov_68.353629_5_plen_33_part_00
MYIHEYQPLYIVHVEYMDYVYGASRVLTVFIL